MKFGCHIMGVSLRHMPEVIQGYEENGFESVWVPEHLVFPATIPPAYPYTPSGYPIINPDTPSYDPWALLSYLACATTKIRLATNVFILPLRHPLQTARSVITVERLSGGRVTLGIGVGWLKDEFDYVGQPFHNRGKRADATIGILRRLWSEDVIEVHDEHFDFGPVKFQPKPLQKPSIPIEIGGAAPAALRRAGRLGDGWIEIGATSIDDFAAKAATVLDARRESGRTGNFEITAGSQIVQGLDAGQSLDGYRSLRDAGATRILVGPPLADYRVTPQDAIDWAKRFADEVIADFDE
jgi:probable F420-dependent oxidoreductase